jgi:hypothetical protein
VKEVYLLATEQAQAPSQEELAAALDTEDVELTFGQDGYLFVLQASGSKLGVRFETLDSPLGWTPELITGSDEAHQLLRRARGIYRIAFDPGTPQPSVAVFEALWCARALLEQVPGVVLDVTAFKLHDLEDVLEITELEFDIRDHVNLHAVEATEGDAPLWVHSHGMEKFGARDVELFYLSEEDLLPAESFMHQLCTDLAFGQSPQPRSAIETESGAAFMLLPSEEARANLMGVPLETFEGHEGLFLTVVASDGRHTMAEMLKPYRGRFAQEPPERSEILRKIAQELLPAFKARFQRRGLMEPLTFLVRTRFESHPEDEPVEEDLWLEVMTWEEGVIVGKLVDGSAHTTEWRKGAQVQIEDEHINALAISRDGQSLDEQDTRALLLSERPM